MCIRAGQSAHANASATNARIAMQLVIASHGTCLARSCSIITRVVVGRGLLGHASLACVMALPRTGLRCNLARVIRCSRCAANPGDGTRARVAKCDVRATTVDAGMAT